MQIRKRSRPFSRVLIPLLIASALGSKATAQSSGQRDPTPNEKAAIMKVYDAFNPVIRSFLAAHGMELDMGQSFLPETHELSVPTAGTIGESFTWECVVAKGSQRFQDHTQPAIAKIDQLEQAGNYDEAKSVRQEMSKWTNFKIEVELNSESLVFGNSPEKNTSLAIAGPAVSFLRADDPGAAPEEQGMRVLAFGNWKDARHDTENHADRFHFSRPPQTPFVENLVVTVSGAEDLVREFLEKTDWGKAADSLTP